MMQSYDILSFSASFSFKIFAFAVPTTAASSLSSASRMRFTLCHLRKSSAFVFGPMPGTSSNALATWCLLRLSR